MEKKKMKKPTVDLKKLRNGEEVRCPECKEGILRTEYHDTKKAHHFECDKCGMMINFD
jgi:small subunit ribosomal protein S27Ae